MIRRAGDTERFNFTGNVQTYVIPVSGVYKIECYGAGGGTVVFRERTLNGGRGAYVKGYMRFTKGQRIYVCCGGRGYNGGTGTAIGGYNGGGNGGGWTEDPTDVGASTKIARASGGGATHISLVNRGTLNNFSTHTNELICVAGGGGGAYAGDRYGDGVGGDTSQLANYQFGKGESINEGSGGGGGYQGGRATSTSGSGGSSNIGSLESYQSQEPLIEVSNNRNNGYVILTLLGANIFLKLNGQWKSGVPYVKVNGQWKQGNAYVKINGQWRN